MNSEEFLKQITKDDQLVALTYAVYHQKRASFSDFTLLKYLYHYRTIENEPERLGEVCAMFEMFVENQEKTRVVLVAQEVQKMKQAISSGVAARNLFDELLLLEIERLASVVDAVSSAGLSPENTFNFLCQLLSDGGYGVERIEIRRSISKSRCVSHKTLKKWLHRNIILDSKNTEKTDELISKILNSGFLTPVSGLDKATETYYQIRVSLPSGMSIYDSDLGCYWKCDDSLMSCLRASVFRKSAFLRMLSDANTEEDRIVLFCDNVEEYKAKMDITTATEIIQRFIIPGAEFEIQSIPPPIKKSIMKIQLGATNPSPDLFNEAHQAVFQKLEDGPYEQFKHDFLSFSQSQLVPWFTASRSTHQVTILIFFDPEDRYYDKHLLQEWNRVVDDIHLKNAQIYAICNQTQDFACNYKILYDLDMDIIGDANNELAAHLDTVIPDTPSILNNGKLETAVILMTPNIVDKCVISAPRAGVHPGKAKYMNYPDPMQSWYYFKNTSVERKDTRKASRGCPFTKCGWQETRNINYKTYQKPVKISGKPVAIVNYGKIQFKTRPLQRTNTNQYPEVHAEPEKEQDAPSVEKKNRGISGGRKVITKPQQQQPQQQLLTVSDAEAADKKAKGHEGKFEKRKSLSIMTGKIAPGKDKKKQEIQISSPSTPPVQPSPVMFTEVESPISKGARQKLHHRDRSLTVGSVPKQTPKKAEGDKTEEVPATAVPEQTEESEDLSERKPPSPRKKNESGSMMSKMPGKREASTTNVKARSKTSFPGKKFFTGSKKDDVHKRDKKDNGKKIEEEKEPEIDSSEEDEKKHENEMEIADNDKEIDNEKDVENENEDKKEEELDTEKHAEIDELTKLDEDILEYFLPEVNMEAIQKWIESQNLKFLSQSKLLEARKIQLSAKEKHIESQQSQLSHQKGVLLRQRDEMKSITNKLTESQNLITKHIEQEEQDKAKIAELTAELQKKDLLLKEKTDQIKQLESQYQLFFKECSTIIQNLHSNLNYLSHQVKIPTTSASLQASSSSSNAHTPHPIQQESASPVQTPHTPLKTPHSSNPNLPSVSPPQFTISLHSSTDNHPTIDGLMESLEPQSPVSAHKPRLPTQLPPPPIVCTPKGPPPPREEDKKATPKDEEKKDVL